MRKLRNKILLSSGAVATLAGIGVAVTPQAAHASTIVLDPIIAPLINLLLAIPL